jgi:hypothetical protein
MKYNCIDCNYCTDDSCNWSKHIKTQKHFKNVSNNTNLKKEQDGANYLSTQCQPLSTLVNTTCQPLSTLVNTTCQPLSTLVNTTCQPLSTLVNPTCQPNVNPMSTQHQHGITSSLNNNKLNISHSRDEFKFICLNCNGNFTTRQALSRHKKNSCSQNQKNDDLVTKLNEELKELKKRNDELENNKEYLKNEELKELKELKKRNDELENDKEYLKNTTSDAICAVKYSSVALKFVTENYSNAPLLKAMPDYLAIKKDCGGRDLARVYCEFYRDGTLVRYLAQFFLDHYKKTKPEEQSFWNTDCSRLSYVICTIVDNQASWVTDKKGVELKKHIIKPLFDHIEKELYGFLKNPENLKHTSLINSCTSLIQDIQSSVISDELLRYLAPHFQISNYKTHLAITERVVPTHT